MLFRHAHGTARPRRHLHPQLRRLTMRIALHVSATLPHEGRSQHGWSKPQLKTRCHKWLECQCFAQNLGGRRTGALDRRQPRDMVCNAWQPAQASQRQHPPIAGTHSATSSQPPQQQCAEHMVALCRTVEALFESCTWHKHEHKHKHNTASARAPSQGRL